jgi:hypothetical protein
MSQQVRYRTPWDLYRVWMFQVWYKERIKYGMNKLEAFRDAVIQTSDDKVRAEDPRVQKGFEEWRVNFSEPLIR